MKCYQKLTHPQMEKQLQRSSIFSYLHPDPDGDDQDDVLEEAEGGVIACSDPGKPLHRPRYSF